MAGSDRGQRRWSYGIKQAQIIGKTREKNPHGNQIEKKKQRRLKNDWKSFTIHTKWLSMDNFMKFFVEELFNKWNKKENFFVQKISMSNKQRIKTIEKEFLIFKIQLLRKYVRQNHPKRPKKDDLVVSNGVNLSREKGSMKAFILSNRNWSRSSSLAFRDDGAPSSYFVASFKKIRQI